MSNNLLESLWARVDTNIGARIKQISELLTQALSANTESTAARDAAVAAEQTATTAATNAASSEAAAKSAESSASSHAQSAQASATSSLSAAERAELAAEETIQQVEGDFATRNYVDQRVPVDMLTGTGFPEGKVAAPVGTVYTDTAATNGAIRWIKAHGTGNTGWRVEYGNTGLRDITSLIEGDAGTGTARIQRIGNTVMLSLFNIPTPGDGSFERFLNFIPEGFRSSFAWQYLGIGKPVSMDASGPIRIGTDGTLIIYRTPSEGRANGAITYISDTPWPTTLPGIPA